ncbi:MAG TPA: hypothetical protein C5S37_09570 [Methanophagales archaeon]|nr:hypothetical protein [Methanophagales archaeon]
MKIGKRALISAGITIFILAILFLKVDLGLLLESLQTINYWYLALAFIGYLGLNFALAFRLFWLLNKLGYHHYSYWNILLFHFTSMILGDVTPGKVGYFGLLLLLKDVKTEDTLSVLTIGQIMDFIMKIAGTVAFAVILSGILLEFQAVLLAGITMMVALTAIASLLIWSEKTLKLLSFFSFGPLKKVTNLVEDVQASTSRLKSELVKALLISIAGWVFVGAQWYFIFLALSPTTNISFLFFFLLQAVVSTLAFIPVSLGGAGLQESAIVIILGIPGVGVGYTLALTFGILVRGMSILVDAGFGTFNLRKISLRGILEDRKWLSRN